MFPKLKVSTYKKMYEKKRHVSRGDLSRTAVKTLFIKSHYNHETVSSSAWEIEKEYEIRILGGFNSGFGVWLPC